MNNIHRIILHVQFPCVGIPAVIVALEVTIDYRQLVKGPKPD